MRKNLQRSLLLIFGELFQQFSGEVYLQQKVACVGGKATQSVRVGIAVFIKDAYKESIEAIRHSADKNE